MLMVDSFVFHTDLRELRLERKSYERGNAKHISGNLMLFPMHQGQVWKIQLTYQRKEPPSVQINRSHLCKQEDWQKECKCICSQ